MSVRKLKPITPGQRFRIVNNFGRNYYQQTREKPYSGSYESGGEITLVR